MTLESMENDFSDPFQYSPGKDYIYDMMIGLRERRKKSIEYEISRLTTLAEEKTK